jgi:hypothetical protein
MINTVDWVTIGKDVAGSVVPILAFIIGKAQKRGENQATLSQMSEDMKVQKALTLQHMALLSRHTTLHEGQMEANRRVEERLEEFNRLLGRISGKLDID